MSNGLLNIGYINGLFSKSYELNGGAFITIFQDCAGDLRAIVVDNGLDIEEFEYAKPASKVRQSNRPGVLQGRSDS